RGRGGVLNISSGFGLEFMPGFAAYVGSKHFVTGFSESLRAELRSAGIVVSQACPGPVATEFAEVAGTFPLPRALQYGAEQCARAIVRGFARGRALILPGLMMKLLFGLRALTPRPVRRLIYGWVADQMRRRSARARTATDSAS